LGAEDVGHVVPVVFVVDVEEALSPPDLAEGPDDVLRGALPNVLNPRVEVLEDVVLDGFHAVFFEELHRVAAVLFEATVFGLSPTTAFPRSRSS